MFYMHHYQYIRTGLCPVIHGFVYIYMRIKLLWTCRHLSVYTLHSRTIWFWNPNLGLTEDGDYLDKSHLFLQGNSNTSGTWKMLHWKCPSHFLAICLTETLSIKLTPTRHFILILVWQRGIHSKRMGKASRCKCKNTCSWPKSVVV